MADFWHVKWLSEGVERWNRRRKKVHFVPDLSGLRFFELLPSDFRDAPKTSRFFEGIDFSQANLAGADLSGLNFYKAKFASADLTGADMSMSNFNRANFTGADLRDADVSRSLFAGAVFEKSRLAGITFQNVDISDAVFIESHLSAEQQSTAISQSAHIFSDVATYRIELMAKGRGASGSGAVLYDREARGAQEPRTRKNRYDVFFGTDRTPIFERGALVAFDGNRSADLSYGVCEVIVPEGHRIGSLGSSLWKRLINRRDDRLKVESLFPLNEELFWSLLCETSVKMKIKERPTIFVHGFNTSFEQAVLRAAQLGYDLGLGQGIGLFSWPSKGKVMGYSADEASAEASKYALADFIEKFVEYSAQQSANIIAHSMGCRTVLGAIEVLSAGKKGVLRRLNQVVLAAADVDSNIMPRLAVHAVSNSKRTTSYVSDKDIALKASGWLHDFPRVGITPPTFLLEGMDTVLVNDVDLGDFSHGYIGTSRAILGDIFSLLKTNSPPDERHALEAVSVGARGYWRIRK